MLNLCSSSNLLPEQLVTDFEESLNQLFSVSVYDEDLWLSTYKETQNRIAETKASDAKGVCSQLEPVAPHFITYIRKEYAEIKSARRDDFQAMLQSIAEMGNSIGSNQTGYSPSGSSSRSNPISQNATPEYKKTRVYIAEQCSGAVVKNVCHGAIIDAGVPKYCYGSMVNGDCKGRIGY